MGQHIQSLITADKSGNKGFLQSLQQQQLSMTENLSLKRAEPAKLPLSRQL